MDEVGLWKRVSLKLGPERSPIEGGKCSPGGVRQKARGGGSPFPSFLFYFFLFSFPFFPPLGLCSFISLNGRGCGREEWEGSGVRCDA